jgi:hypothetical protein
MCRSSRRFFQSDTPHKDLSLNEVLAYRFQQIITGSTATKLGFVLCLCLPYVLASATFYRSLSSESWFQAIYKTYCTLFRTPGSVNRETAAGPAIVLNIVFLYGFLFFAVFLGLITEDIKDQISTFREGSTPVAQAGHTVRTPRPTACRANKRANIYLFPAILDGQTFLVLRARLDDDIVSSHCLP